MDNKRFGCKIKFLEHGLEKHKHNKFLPRETIIKTHSTLLNRQKELEVFKEIDGIEL